MRIALISYFGLADYTISLANALAKKNDVMLILARKSALPFIKYIDHRIHCNLVDFPRLRNPLNLYYAIKIYRQLVEYKPDVIHFQGGFIWFAFLLPWIRKWPLVTTIHDYIPHLGDYVSQRMRWFLPNQLAVKYSKKVIVHGNYIKSTLIEGTTASDSQVSSILPGDGFLYRSNSVVEPVENRILFYGRIMEYKGLSSLIKAQPFISKEIPDLKICIAGEGKLIQRYEAQLKANDCFEIYNYYIDKELTAKLFQEASLIVLPYNMASQSGVVSIAYSFSRPVVATSVGCLPEIVEHDKTGLLVPPRDEKKLAEAIIELLKQKEKCKQFGINAYKKVTEEMSWKNIADRTIDIYSSALKTA